MRSRPNRFANLFYDGDWHSRLISSMELAKKGSRSQEILSAIATLEQLLSESDECQHTVMAVQAVPAGIALEFALDCVRECIDVTPAEIRLSASGELVLTITGRGDYGHVQLMAKSILSCGINRARAAIWVSEIR